MKLFDENVKAGTDYRKYAESYFSYFNRSSRHTIKKIKEIFEGWYCKYPEEQKGSLRKNFRRNNNKIHKRAFFKLFVHELFLRLNCKIQANPIIQGCCSSPDFLMETLKGEKFYLDTILASNETDEEARLWMKTDKIYELIEDIKSKRFYVVVHVNNYSKKLPSKKSIQNKVAGWLKNLPEMAHRENMETEELPSFYYGHNGWQIVFYAYPRKERGNETASSVRPPGMLLLKHKIQEDDQIEENIYNIILNKVGLYKKIDLPYILAINIYNSVDFKSDLLDVLYGEKLNELEEAIINKANRPDDGVFTNDNQKKSKGISAVLAFNKLTPWKLTLTDYFMFQNPFAQLQAPLFLDILHTAREKDKTLEFDYGLLISEILELSTTWPQERDNYIRLSEQQILF
ncbi:MAG: hypothetical protein ACLFQV_08555 [Vulcanimicrobiota bacterium]